MGQLECQLGILECWKGKNLLISHICCGPSARLNIPKAQINSKLYAVFGVFAVKYTYFKPQNILIEAKNILMISYTYEAKICRTTPGCTETHNIRAANDGPHEGS